jgi:hypothetical protein
VTVAFCLSYNVRMKLHFRLRTLLALAVLVCLTAPTWPTIGQYISARLHPQPPAPRTSVRVVPLRVQTFEIPVERKRIEEAMRIDELQHQQRIRTLMRPE